MKGVVLMTLRELLKNLNLPADDADSVQKLEIVNVDNFCLFNLLDYLRSNKFKEDIVTCASDMDEAEQLGRNPSLYFTHEFNDGNLGITIKVCDTTSDSKN